MKDVPYDEQRDRSDGPEPVPYTLNNVYFCGDRILRKPSMEDVWNPRWDRLFVCAEEGR